LSTARIDVFVVAIWYVQLMLRGFLADCHDRSPVPDSAFRPHLPPARCPHPCLVAEAIAMARVLENSRIVPVAWRWLVNLAAP
jgi:hypothetical protein